MDSPSIAGSGPGSEDRHASQPPHRGPLRFPGDDGGLSLNEMAERDLAAALQLLAERAQYITGAAGAAIALLEAGKMICRASAGSSAPELGAHLQVDAGLSGESVRQRQILRCNDAENDPRVNRESCRSLGIASVVVMPLVREHEVNGVFELMADRINAFEDRDIVALERLGEMIQTAVEHAEAAKRAPSNITVEEEITIQTVENVIVADTEHEYEEDDEEDAVLSVDGDSGDLQPKYAPKIFQLARSQENASSSVLSEPHPLAGEPAAVRKCASCGFPVSGTRLLCLDCESAQASNLTSPIISSEPDDFLPPLNSHPPKGNWLRSHLYLVATILIAAATVALLLWRRV